MSPQSQKLDDHLYGEDHGEDHVEDVHDGGERLRLLVMLRGQKRSNHHNTEMDEFLCVCVLSRDVCVRRYLNSQSEGVSQDQRKHDVFKLTGVDYFPEFELGGVFGDVNLDRLSFEGVVHTLTLQGGQRDERELLTVQQMHRSFKSNHNDA